MAPTSDDWHARHARTSASGDAAQSPASNDAARSLASNGAARSPAVRFDGPPENEEWDVRHGHVRTLAEQ